MIFQHLVTLIVLFAISFTVILHEANVSTDIALRTAIIVAVLKGTAVGLIDTGFQRIRKRRNRKRES